MNENTLLMLVVTITGILVVFAALILLTLFIKLYGSLVSRLVGSDKKKKKENPAAKPAAQARQTSAPKTVPVPVVQEGISGEVVAAIAAAVSVLSDDGKAYSVRSIKRASGTATRPVWGMAGVMDNTRPF